MILDIKNLKVRFRNKTVLEGLNLHIPVGTSFGLLGESGSGKSTLAKAITGFIKPDEGQILVDGISVQPITWHKQNLEARQKVQMVFQDPYASLNPKHTVRQILSEPYIVHSQLIDDQMLTQLLEMVQLDKGLLEKNPTVLSGGQRQRVSLARALAVMPKLLILDESLSALDVVIQAQLLEILKDIQAKTKITYLYITHQKRTADYLCDQLGTMKNGRIVGL